MKNIVITGVPRSGKSTFIKMILNKYNYNVVLSETITSAYADMCMREGINTIDLSVAKNMAIDIFNKSVSFEPRLRFIFDAPDLNFQRIMEFSKKNYIVIVFGYPKLTYDQAFNNIRKYDTKEDWSYYEKDWKIRNLSISSVEDSKRLEKQCKKANIKFIDTSYDREDVLSSTFEWFEKIVNSNF